jgi:hypothetical protein
MIGEEPAYAELFVYQGSTFEVRINFADSAGAAISLAGSTFTAQMRKKKESSTVIEDFTTAVSGSSLTISLTPAETAAIPGGKDKFDPEAIYFFDLDWNTPTGKKKTPISGKVFVVSEVTR